MYSLYDRIQFAPEEILMYLRKSQTDDPLMSVSEVLAKHESTLDEFCERFLHARIPEENRFREILSGGDSIAERPEFQRTLKKLEEPRYRAILSVDVARLGRPDTEEIGKISKILRYTHSFVITPDRIFNVSDEFERRMFEEELKNSYYYLESVKKVLRRGREISVSSGNYIASRPPYGYDKTVVVVDKRKCPTLSINEEQAGIVKLIFESYVNENIGTQLISKRLNELGLKSPRGMLWTADAIRTILENPVYTGLVRWNDRKGVLIVNDGAFKRTRPKASDDERIVSKGKHDAIISQELFDAAQDKRGRTHKTCDNRHLRNPLASLLYCECGRAMSYRHSTRGNLKYRTDPRLVCNAQHICGNGSCSVPEITQFISRILERKIADFTIEAQGAAEEKVRLREELIRNLEKKLSDIDAKEIALWDAQIDTTATPMPAHVFAAITARLAEDRTDAQQALENLKLEQTSSADYAKKVVSLQAALSALNDDDVNIEQKNQLLKSCIERITYRRAPLERIEGQKKHLAPPIDLEISLKI